MIVVFNTVETSDLIPALIELVGSCLYYAVWDRGETFCHFIRIVRDLLFKKSNLLDTQDGGEFILVSLLLLFCCRKWLQKETSYRSVWNNCFSGFQLCSREWMNSVIRMTGS